MVTTGLGVNYLAVCRHRALEDEHAAQVLKGLREVLDGRSAEFMTAYPCHSPHERRWFLVRVIPIVDGSVLVTHLDVSHVDSEPWNKGKVANDHGLVEDDGDGSARRDYVDCVRG